MTGTFVATTLCGLGGMVVVGVGVVVVVVRSLLSVGCESETVWAIGAATFVVVSALAASVVTVLSTVPQAARAREQATISTDGCLRIAGR